MSEWFSSWFNSPYYHLLYKNRDHKEAEEFISNLLLWLKLSPGEHVADIPCGKGRHAIFLNKQGFDVTGVDLAPESIAEANTHQTDTLRFHVGDIRALNFNEIFSVVFNLFTSFGYFDDESENILAMKNLAAGVKPGGRLVIDFMNVERVLKLLVPEERKQIGGICFSIRRFEQDGVLVKTIHVDDANSGSAYNFEERVKIIRHQDFVRYLNVCGLQAVSTFGSYQLDPYIEESSERLILVAEKKK